MMLMREPTYYTLAALLDGPLHGYAIIKRAAELVSTEREEIVNGRARRYYRLTDAGRHALEAEAARMTEAARLVTDRARHRRLNPGTRPA